MLKLCIVLLASVLIGGTTYVLYFSTPTNTNFGTVTIGNKVFHVEIADVEAKRRQGLSGRSAIGSDGMLFVFGMPAKYGFWMKDMKFALDFVWIKDGFVVQTDEVVQPFKTGDVPQTVEPSQEVNYVLELPVGTIQKYGIDQGNQVRVSFSGKSFVQ